jgi:hypothetical protein
MLSFQINCPLLLPSAICHCPLSSSSTSLHSFAPSVTSVCNQIWEKYADSQQSIKEKCANIKTTSTSILFLSYKKRCQSRSVNSKKFAGACAFLCIRHPVTVLRATHHTGTFFTNPGLISISRFWLIASICSSTLLRPL